MKHRPRKRFGQNFLQDQAVINRIITAFNLQEQDKVIEIGPGMGALTNPLLKYLDQLIAVEIDTDLQHYLQTSLVNAEKLQLVKADALEVDYAGFGHDLRIVGNLPYNISTPLLLYLINFIDYIKDMHFMLQKEVVMRIASEPGHKSYGRLSVILQYYCDITYLFDVPPDAFHPKPQVDSAIVRLVPYRNSPYKKVNHTLLEKVVAMAFSMRRKTLANNLKPVLSASQLEEIGINPALRPEQLSVKDFVTITNCLKI